MKFKILKDVKLKGKRVLLRIDINSPVVKERVLDSPRFKESAETIKYLLREGAKAAIIAHQGRKGGDDFVPLNQHANILSRYSGKNIWYVDDLFGKVALTSIDSLKPGQAILLKNVREYEDETNINSKKNKYIEFCRNFDVFVNDAFSVCHRKQGSILLPPKYLPSYIGLNLEKEIIMLKKFHLGKTSTLYIMGGEKIEDYMPIFSNLRNKKNKILASGVLANLLLIAKGYNLGYENKWIEEKGYLRLLPKLKIFYKKYKNQILLPIDFAIESNNRRVELRLSDFPVDSKIRDIGHETVRIFKFEIKKAKTVFMKGPPGFSEIPHFSYATVEILKEISLLSKKKKLFSLIGGGHLTTTISRHRIPNNFSHISLSGGALISYISGEELPGLEALKRRYHFV